jgi:hypothetical protein
MATAQEQARDAEERRYGAVQALNALVECLRETNPQTIFSSKEGSGLEPMKLQNINNRWAEKAADTLSTALDLANCIGVDAMQMFQSHHGTAAATAQESGA